MSSQKPAFRDHCAGGVLELIHGIASWNPCNLMRHVHFMCRLILIPWYCVRGVAVSCTIDWYLFSYRTYGHWQPGSSARESCNESRAVNYSYQQTVTELADHDASSTGVLVRRNCPPWGGCLPADVSPRRFGISSWCWTCTGT